jgi:MFS family permease
MGATVEEQLERVGWGNFHVLALVAFILIIIADGMELVVTNIVWPLLPADKWGLANYNNPRGGLVSVAFAGFVFGCVVSACLGDQIGRRPLIFLHGGTFIAMSLFSATVDSIEQLAFARCMVGVSMGMVLPTVTAMMSEFTPVSWRARATVAIPGVAYSLGQALVLLLGIALDRRARGSPHSIHQHEAQNAEWDVWNCAAWRIMLIGGIVPDAIGLIMVYFFVPESPRYLYFRGRSAEVRESLLHIARLNDAEGSLLDDGHCSPREDIGHSVGWAEAAVRVKELLEAPIAQVLSTVVSVWCCLTPAVIGGSVLMPIYFEHFVKLGREQSYFFMMCIALLEIPSVFAVFTIIDNPHIGRRTVMMYLSAGSALAALTLSFIWSLGPLTLFAGNLVLRLMCLAPYSIMYIYSAELSPTSHRNTVQAIGNGATKVIAGPSTLNSKP